VPPPPSSQSLPPPPKKVLVVVEVAGLVMTSLPDPPRTISTSVMTLSRSPRLKPDARVCVLREGAGAVPSLATPSRLTLRLSVRAE
jgi:hypothetical protein